MKNKFLSKFVSIFQHRTQFLSYLSSHVNRRTLLLFTLTCLSLIFLSQLLSTITDVLFSPSASGRVFISVNGQTALRPYNQSTQLRDKAQGPATCLIIIRSADGQFGNRMFLFASAYGLARLHQCKLWVAPWILNDLRAIFRVDVNHTRVQLTTDDRLVYNRTDIYGRYSACTLYSDLFRVPLQANLTRYEMVGFYQAYGYFEKYREEINFLFQFNTGAISKNVPLVEQLLKAVWNIPLKLGNYTRDTVPHGYLKSLLIQAPAGLPSITWVGIHIRRGDFLSFFKIDTSVEYLTWSMNYFRRKYHNVRFLIASDDKKYVQATLGNNSDIFITPSNFFAGDDLAALALCEHTIATAGTYGWWAGWLAGGDVVHDLNYPVAFQNCVKEHYFPPWFLFPHNSSSLGTHPVPAKA